MPSSTDPMFSTLLKQKGVYFNIREASPPEDWKAVFMDLQKKRNEPDKQQIQELFQRLGYIYNEEIYKVHFATFIFNPPSRKLPDHYSAQMDIEWTRIKDEFDTNKELPNPKPDYFECFSIDQYPKEALNALSWSIKPSVHPIAIPTFCVEFKGPEKSTRNAQAQAAYDGAIMVNAAWEIHKSMKRPAREVLGKTKALVVALADEILNLLHAVQYRQSRTRARMNTLKKSTIISSE
jgi:hypothetical protein